MASATPVINTQKAGKAWEWMWGNPPDSNYVSKSLHTCSVGNVFTHENAQARHIASVQIFSNEGAISGINVTYADGLKSEKLTVPVDKWISDVKLGCTGDVISYLSLATNGGQGIAVGSAKDIIHYNSGAAYQFLGAAGHKGLTAFGAEFSEPETSDD
ncbi:protein of unknown function [Taphrina deformans PYCC 5710]|uniref:Uncharacterized protein n=1 Tax=Taphrina deformans (strain PYCC 5710 / ATCC 11124 / CBS 356.35 / IMI 108563 / JCM 9778 / NBRC 8474) TaxID=1097556 RepID=R4X864_TAPDE|nr:protein of unknown function [Taphrina deformans PYCC 5710]|eukprot:CCG81719.1 protein of unknown function [Taphrina deformans PYCC 5710]